MINYGFVKIVKPFVIAEKFSILSQINSDRSASGREYESDIEIVSDNNIVNKNNENINLFNMFNKLTSDIEQIKLSLLNLSNRQDEINKENPTLFEKILT